MALGAEALKMRRRLFGGDHHDVQESLRAQGGLLGRLGRAAEAEPLLVEAVAMARRLFGEGHPMLRNARDELATNYWREGKLDLSIPEFESLLAERRKLLEPGDVELLGTMANLGINYKDAGRFAEAIPLLEEARRGVGRTPALGFVKLPLLEAYASGADPAKPGEPMRVVLLVKEMLPEVRAELSVPSLDLASVLAQMGTALVGVRAWDEAQPLLAECLEIRQAEQPEDWRTFNTRSLLGAALLGKGRHAEAEPLLLAGYEGMKSRAEKVPEAAKGKLVLAADRLGLPGRHRHGSRHGCAARTASSPATCRDDSWPPGRTPLRRTDQRPALCRCPVDASDQPDARWAQSEPGTGAQERVRRVSSLPAILGQIPGRNRTTHRC